jgi:DNA invertase Pin-like site-specific DNA recombinase
MVHEYQLQQPDLRKPAIIYRRVSTDTPEQNGESLEQKKEKFRKYAELHAIKVVAVFKEEAGR